MANVSWAARRRVVWLAAGVWICCCGCPRVTPPDDDPNDPSDGNTPILDEDGNFSVNTATVLNFGGDNTLTFRGRITNASDIDVFRLGRLDPGDRVIADVQALNGDLDAVAALFDGREYLVAFNDDREADGSDLDPRLDLLMPEELSGIFYLAISGYPGSNTAGDYEVYVEFDRGGTPFAPQRQIVFLDWDGGDNITIPNVGTYDLPPFSATQVGFAASTTAQLKDRVQEIVESRYAGYDLLALNSDDDPVPGGGHTTVYFGSVDARAFAISEQIDTFNQDVSDDAIVYTGSFRDAFIVTPSLEQMAQALGNTVAHEVGHLLGLVHTADCADMMDTTCYNERILTEQLFGTAPLDTSVFTFGYQDAEAVLGWLLGLVGL